jgi:hypothetical protein
MVGEQAGHRAGDLGAGVFRIGYEHLPTRYHAAAYVREPVKARGEFAGLRLMGTF